MNVYPTPEFAAKVHNLPANVKSDISTLLNRLKDIQNPESLRELVQRGPVNCVLPSDEGDDIYVINMKQYNLFATVGNDGQQDYVLLLDISTPIEPVTSIVNFGTRDPKANWLIDPNRNWLIDPNRNWLIDPNRNWLIDPNRNWLIDPRRNWLIDPNRNWLIDFRRNWLIDPSRNWLVDPKRNMTVRPNPSNTNSFVSYDKGLVTTSYLVAGNDKVKLIFDMRDIFQGVAVANDKGFAVFDTQNVWNEHMVATQEGPLIRFSIGNEWLGIVIR